MNNIKLFKNEKFGEIKTLFIEDEVWFVWKDVLDFKVIKILEIHFQNILIFKTEEVKKYL